MFGRYRKELEGLKKQLEDLSSAVPAEALVFHQQIRSISEAADGLLAKWYLSDGKQVDKLKLRTNKLDSLSHGLIELVRTGQRVAGQISSLRERAGDSDEHAFIIKRCDAWMSIINKLGKDVEQEIHLQLDQQEVLKIESSVREHLSAVDLLDQAEKYCRTLGPMDTALLKASLPRFKDDFRLNGPSPQMLSELETLLEPLQRAPQQARPPEQKMPEGIQVLRRLYAELKNWASVQGQEVPRDLQDSYRRINQAGDALPSDIQDLQQSFTRELQALRDSAATSRAEKLQQLRQDADHYQRACGVNRDLAGRIETLAGNPGDSVPNYEEWIESCQEAEQFLAGIAQARQEVLSSYLQSRVRALEKRRQKLAEGPLTRVLRTDTVSLGAVTGSLHGVAGQMNIRQALRTADSAETKLAALERQAQEDIAAYTRKVHALRGRIVEMKDAAHTFDKSETTAACEGFQRRIDEELALLNDLDEMNSRLANIEGAERSLTATFLDDAGTRLRSLFTYCQNAHRAVSTASEALSLGFREPMLSRPQLVPESPRAAAQELNFLQQLQRSYQDRIKSLSGKVELEVKNGRARLVALLGEAGYLSPQQQDEGGELVKAMEETSSLPADGDVLTSFAALAFLLDRFKTFVRLTEGEREEMQKFHGALKERLRKFSEEDFRRLFPEAAERASCLIYGLDPAWPCNDMRKQLKLAAGLLDRAETQARRLAADELEKACVVAAVYLRTPQRRWAEQVRSTVSEIGEYAPSQLAPASLRRRLLQSLNLVGGVGNA